MRAFLYGVSALAYWLAYTGRRPACLPLAGGESLFAGGDAPFAGDATRCAGGGCLPGGGAAGDAKGDASLASSSVLGADDSAYGTRRNAPLASSGVVSAAAVAGDAMSVASRETHVDVRAVGATVSRDGDAEKRQSAAGVVTRAFSLFPHMKAPLHVLVPNPAKVNAKGIVCHRSSRSFGRGSFFPVDELMGVCSPELCFVQVARHLPLHQAIKAGCALCGSFAVSPRSEFGLVSRRPLTTRAAIAEYLESNKGIAGAKRARRALRYVVEGCASPAEIRLAMTLTLPYEKGGFSVPGLCANRAIELGKKAVKVAGRRRVVPDLLNAEQKVAIEYDADVTHASGQRRMQDATKRMVLESMGFKVVTVTTKQLGLGGRMRDVAEDIRRHMGMPLRIRSASFEKNHRLLTSMPKSFDGLFARRWLIGCEG